MCLPLHHAPEYVQGGIRTRKIQGLSLARLPVASPGQKAERAGLELAWHYAGSFRDYCLIQLGYLSKRKVQDLNLQGRSRRLSTAMPYQLGEPSNVP